MLDWLRYLPIAFTGLRDTQTFVIPKGPYFPKLRAQRWHIDDSFFHFKAPWSNSTYGSEQFRGRADGRSCGVANILEYSLSPASPSIMPNNRWQSGWFYSRKWFFMGPWFTGHRADLHMTCSLKGQTVLDDFKGSSFFHPRVFETVIADYLSSIYGFDKMDKKARYRGPLNWKVLPISSIIHAASFEIFDGQGSEITKYVLFPVSHDRFVCISFVGLYQREVNYDQTPLITLMQSIIDSFQLEVGPTMQSQWDEVKAYCPDMSLTNQYGELKWPIKPQDVGRPIDAPSSEKDLLDASTLKALN